MVAMLTACSSSDGAASDSGEAVASTPTALPAPTTPVATPTPPPSVVPVPVSTVEVPMPPEENQVPFSSPQDLVGDDPRRQPLQRPSVQPDFEPVDDVLVFDDGVRRITLIEAYLQNGLTFGAVQWEEGGVLRSQSSLVSEQLAQCAVDIYAQTQDAHTAELSARGVFADEADAPLGLAEEAFDIYVACGGTDELLMSFHLENARSINRIFEPSCMEATITNEDHLRLMLGIGRAQSSSEIPDAAIVLLGPCFDWSSIGLPISEASLACLEQRPTDGVRMVFADNPADTPAVFSDCLTDAELIALGF